jgi:hypothetical protein
MEEDGGGVVSTRLGDVRKPRQVSPNENGESASDAGSQGCAVQFGF